jgi:hypothetical protein
MPSTLSKALLKMFFVFFLIKNTVFFINPMCSIFFRKASLFHIVVIVYNTTQLTRKGLVYNKMCLGTLKKWDIVKKTNYAKLFKEILKAKPAPNVSMPTAAPVNYFVAYSIKWEFNIYIVTKLPQKLNAILTRIQIINDVISLWLFNNMYAYMLKERSTRKRCMYVLWSLKHLTKWQKNWEWCRWYLQIVN